MLNFYFLISKYVASKWLTGKRRIGILFTSAHFLFTDVPNSIPVNILLSKCAGGKDMEKEMKAVD